MHRRHQHLNIPIEIVRTVVAIAEAGSLTKAGEKLNLSQPAVSAQIKRIQGLLGGELFTKTPNGASPTELGKLVLREARRMLEANDQMLRLGGVADGPQPLRLGISGLFLEEFFAQETAASLSDLVIHTDHSMGITKGLLEGYIDVACLFENAETASEISDLIINEREERFVWVKSKDFVLTPGAAVPLLTWPGDDLTIRTLTRNGNAYKIVFTSHNYHAIITALKKGIGVAALPSRMIPSPLVEAKDYYLPELPPVRALLYARLESDTPKAQEVLKRLSKLFFQPPD